MGGPSKKQPFFLFSGTLAKSGQNCRIWPEIDQIDEFGPKPTKFGSIRPKLMNLAPNRRNSTPIQAKLTNLSPNRRNSTPIQPLGGDLGGPSKKRPFFCLQAHWRNRAQIAASGPKSTKLTNLAPNQRNSSPIWLLIDEFGPKSMKFNPKFA